jgi:hypothetical protein
MPFKSTKVTASQARSSSHRKADSIPKAKPLAVSRPAQPFLVIDTTLPSHIVTDRSLFTMYTAGRKVYRTTFGHDIVIEGTGDVHIRVFAAGQYICFRLRNCWHVPSSAHHFLSCAIVTSLGYQVMIAGRSPRMISSHKRRLVEPKLPKYIPFTQVDGLIVLKFDIPAQPQVPILPQPASITSHSTAQTVYSLQASTFLPFAGLVFKQNSLPAPHQVSSPRSQASASACEDMAAANVRGHASVMSDTSSDVALHGGADALVGVDVGFPLTDDVNVALHGGIDAQMMVPVDLPLGVVVVADGGAAHDDVAADVVDKHDGAAGDDAIYVANGVVTVDDDENRDGEFGLFTEEDRTATAKSQRAALGRHPQIPHSPTPSLSLSIPRLHGSTGDPLFESYAGGPNASGPLAALDVNPVPEIIIPEPGGAVHRQAIKDVGTRGANGGVDNRVVEATDVQLVGVADVFLLFHLRSHNFPFHSSTSPFSTLFFSLSVPLSLKRPSFFPQISLSHPILPHFSNSEFSEILAVYLCASAYQPFSFPALSISHFLSSQHSFSRTQFYVFVYLLLPFHFPGFSFIPTPYIVPISHSIQSFTLDQILSRSTSVYSPARRKIVSASRFRSSSTISPLFQWSLLAASITASESIAASAFATPLSQHSVVHHTISSMARPRLCCTTCTPSFGGILTGSHGESSMHDDVDSQQVSKASGLQEGRGLGDRYGRQTSKSTIEDYCDSLYLSSPPHMFFDKHRSRFLHAIDVHESFAHARRLLSRRDLEYCDPLASTISSITTPQQFNFLRLYRLIFHFIFPLSTSRYTGT